MLPGHHSFPGLESANISIYFSEASMRAITNFLMPFLALALLCGCASRYGTQNTRVSYYPMCYQPIYDLRDRENTVGKSTAGGALVGALGGALLGLLAGDGKWQGALMGAAVGGVGGSMAGHAYGTHQQEQDDNRRMASYLQNLDGDIYDMDISTAAARTSLNCYDKQFKVLLAAIKAGTIDRRSAAARFAEIQSGREEAINILGDAAYMGNSLEQQYEDAFLAEERDMQMQARTGSTVARQQQRVLQAARQKKQTLAKKTTQARKEQASAQTTTTAQTQAINQAMAGLEELKI